VDPPVSDEVIHFDEYDVLGYRILAGAPGPHPLAEMRRLLEGFGPITPSGDALPAYELAVVGGRWHARWGRTVFPMDRDFESALTFLEWHIISDALTGHPELLHLHGAALATPRGEGAVVLLGRSGSGKSTLTLALMEHGFEPYADDVALIAPVTLELTALRRAFHADEDSLGRVAALAGRPAAVRPVMAGYVSPLAWSTRRLPLRWLLLLDLQPGASPVLVRLPPAEAAHAIMAHSINLSQSTRVAMATCAHVTARVACFRFTHGDLRRSVDAVGQLLSDGAPRPLA
jgi:hypothetical protein